jgi:ubiquinone/menaquinone biosynthesis C-methylase UbiE
MGSKEYFDEVAREWDKLRSSFFSEEVREKAFTKASVREGELAADIGAGTGFFTEGLVKKGLTVIAVDQSEAMLEVMRKKFTGMNGIEYRIGEAEKLPISDGSVDYAFANMYLHHVESPPIAIKEMVRILKPGGKIVITDMDEHDFEFLKEEQHDRWMGFKREDILKWFKEAGLKDIVVEDLGEQCCSESNTGKASASVSLFLAIGENLI